MQYNFDVEHSRAGTGSVKWEFLPQGDEYVYGDHADPKHGDQRILPLWVADMDFRAPQAVIDALQARAAHGIFGYTAVTPAYRAAVVAWMARRHNWSIRPEWLVPAPGIVTALYVLVRAFTAPGDKVLIQRPVYHPFTFAVEENGREVVSNSLRLENGRYRMDFDDLARKTADPAVKLAILCNPHNPVGRVWTAEELRRLGEICLQNDVLVIADEIHHDLIYRGCVFTPFTALGDDFAARAITCTAPSKTFNLAGLKSSNVIIADPALRGRFELALRHSGVWGMNCFGPAATEAAYTHGAPWLEAVMAYVEENYRFMEAYLAEHLPQLRPLRPEGTYLVWLDCRALGLDEAARRELLLGEARVFIEEGEIFGPEGAGFERLNLACPRAILAEALARIRRVVTARPGATAQPS